MKKYLKPLMLIIAMTLVLFVLASCTTPSNGVVEISLTYDSNGGSYVGLVTYRSDYTVKLPKNPTKPDETFEGWYWDKDTWKNPLNLTSVFSMPIHSDLIVYAKWSGSTVTDLDSLKTLAIGEIETAFLKYSAGYTGNYAAILSEKGKGIQAVNAAASQESIASAKQTCIAAMASFPKDRLTVSFNTQGGSNIDSVVVIYGEKVNKPANPSKSGYTFDDWYTDASLTARYNFTKPLTANITLYAGWTNTSPGKEMVSLSDLSFLPAFDPAESEIVEKEGKLYHGFLAMSGPVKTEYSILALYNDGSFIMEAYVLGHDGIIDQALLISAKGDWYSENNYIIFPNATMNFGNGESGGSENGPTYAIVQDDMLLFRFIDPMFFLFIDVHAEFPVNNTYHIIPYPFISVVDTFPGDSLPIIRIHIGRENRPLDMQYYYNGLDFYFNLIEIKDFDFEFDLFVPGIQLVQVEYKDTLIDFYINVIQVDDFLLSRLDIWTHGEIILKLNAEVDDVIEYINEKLSIYGYDIINTNFKLSLSAKHLVDLDTSAPGTFSYAVIIGGKTATFEYRVYQEIKQNFICYDPKTNTFLGNLNVNVCFEDGVQNSFWIQEYMISGMDYGTPGYQNCFITYASTNYPIKIYIIDTENRPVEFIQYTSIPHNISLGESIDLTEHTVSYSVYGSYDIITIPITAEMITQSYDPDISDHQEIIISFTDVSGREFNYSRWIIVS